MPLLEDLKAYLVASGVSWSISLGYLPDDADQAIGIFETGGYPANTLDNQTETVTVQVRIRAGRHDYATARGQWATCFDLLQDTDEIRAGGGLLPGVIYVMAMHFGPLAFNDPEGRPNFTSNWRVMRYRY